MLTEEEYQRKLKREGKKMTTDDFKLDYPDVIPGDPIHTNLDDPMRHNIGGNMNRPPRNDDPLSPRNIEHDHIDKILEERGDRYGAFKDHAQLCQELKAVMRTGRSWHKASPSQRQALETIADKIARMLNGDPHYDDNWVDIIGYSQLVLNELRKV